jgi:hypothetical protein
MARVRRHTVTRDGKTHTRRQHTRRGGGGIKFRPRRAWFNAKRSWSLRKRRRVLAACLGVAAVAEITGFFVFRAAGGILVPAGLLITLFGAGMYQSTKS